MNRGDIYLVSLDPSEGREQRGSRSVIIVSATEFNRVTKLPVVCPITTGGSFVRKIGFAVALHGLQTQGVVRCDQPRVLDLIARGAFKLESVPNEILDEIMARLEPIFK